jgi:hypothetical protein
MLKLDEGNPENKVDFRDDVWQWKAPFENPSLILKKQRFLALFGKCNYSNCL